MLSSGQIGEIQRSWQQMIPISEPVADLFYDRLFEVAPELRPMFTGDMAEQGRKLMAMLGVVVASLERLEAIVPNIEALGRKHAAYGVGDDHYDTVGSALLWTFQEALGDAFSGDTREAWAAAYTILTDTMRGAAAAEAAAA